MAFLKDLPENFLILTCGAKLFKVSKGPTFWSTRQESFPVGLLEIRMAFNVMRHVESPYLHHNQIVSYFEALCVIID